jgi:predicted HTH domain antitoxin
MQLYIPDKLTEAAKMTARELMLELAVALVCNYQLGPGDAGSLVGMTGEEIVQVLTARRISTHYNKKEVEQSMIAARQRGW